MTTPANPMPIPKGSGKGEWWKWKGQVWMRCPNCGASGSFADHNVADDGSVQPSVECFDGCGFHEYVRLLGWPGEE